FTDTLTLTVDVVDRNTGCCCAKGRTPAAASTKTPKSNDPRIIFIATPRAGDPRSAGQDADSARRETLATDRHRRVSSRATPSPARRRGQLRPAATRA